MTIGIGLIASDGIVVASDTQETITGFWKGTIGKFAAAAHRVASGGSRNAILVSAGSVHYMNAIRPEVIKAFQAQSGNSRADIHAVLDDVYRRFHADRLSVFASYPEIERPMVDMIIGVSDGDQRKLLLAQQNIVVRAEPYCAIGIGAHAAYTILGRCYHSPTLDVPHTILLAAYVMQQVKQSVDGCGGDTDMFFIRDIQQQRSRVGLLERKDAADLEIAMAKYLTNAEPYAFRAAIGQPWSRAKSRADSARRGLRRLLPRLLRKEHYKILK